MSPTPRLLILIGAVLFIGANAFAYWTARESDVPNDPNIGAGLLGLIGLVMLVIGVVRLVVGRRGRT